MYIKLRKVFVHTSLNHPVYPFMKSEAVRHNFYVDNFLVLVSTVKKTVTMQQKLTELVARQGFHLTKWILTTTRCWKLFPN